MSENCLQRSIRKLKHNLLENGEYIDEDEMEVLNVFFKLLRLLRFIPQLGQEYSIKDVFVVILLTVPIIWCDCVWNIILQLTYPDKYILNDLINDATIAISFSNLYILMSIIFYKREHFLKFAKKLGDFREFRKPIDFDRANRIANFLITIGSGYTIIGAAAFMLMGTFERSSCFKENEELNIQRVCGMVAPSALPVIFNEFPYYWIMLLISGVAPTTGSMISTLFFTFLFGSVKLITSRMRQLRNQIEHAFKISDINLHKKCIKHCVRYHVFIIELVGGLNQCISWLCFLQAAYSCTALAAVGLQVLVNPEIKHVLHGFAWGCFSIISCSGAQILLDETELVPIYIYDTNWFDYDIDTQKSVLMIIQKGNQELYIDTKMFGPMGLRTFTMIMKNAYAVITMLHERIG